MVMFDYNEANFKKVSELIIKNLSPDLLPKKWIERNSKNPMFGHCHTASGCLQKIFGSKNIKLYRALDDEGIWHWWAKDVNGKVIDLTVDQYLSVGRNPPSYDLGQSASMLGFSYRTRVNHLVDKVLNEYSSTGTPR
jgi:hypothetical protein